MIFSQEYVVKMPKKYRKILYLYAAYNESFFFLGQKQLKQDCVAHVDLRGKILFEFTFDRPVEVCGMLSDRQAIVLETRCNSITIFDLQTYKMERYPHQFMYEEADMSNILTFSETKLLCIEEKGRFGDNRYKLSYYYYPFKKDNANRPCAVYESKDDEWTIKYETMKANNSSMVCWWKPLKDNGFHFFSFDLRESAKGTLKQHTISLQSIFSGLISFNLSHKMEVGVTHIWQIKKSIFFIVSLTSAGNFEKKKPMTRFFIYESDTLKLNEAKFSFGLDQDYMIGCYNLGRSSMFLTYCEFETQIQTSKIYFVDHMNQDIITESNWECNNTIFFEFPGYQSGMICQSTHELEDVQKFEMRMWKFMTLKEMYAYIMLETYPQLDEDLILDVLKLIQISQ